MLVTYDGMGHGKMSFNNSGSWWRTYFGILIMDSLIVMVLASRCIGFGVSMYEHL
jgi:hypothetical protein